MHGVEAYPLQWPAGWPRTKRPQRSRFNVKPAQARDEMIAELRRMGARQIVVSSNIRLRQDGLPYANASYRVDDTGVAAYFMLNGKQQCVPCDRWDRVQDNMQAIRHTIAALRGVDRWGTGRMVEAAFQGFEALPGPDETRAEWWVLMDFVAPPASVDDVKARYRELAKVEHPDKGGSHHLWQAIQEAYEEGLSQMGGGR